MNVCENCPLRLFNNKHYNLQGFGNPWANRVIIVPNVDYNAYKKGDLSYSEQVSILSSLFSTGELADKCYILPLIRCNENLGCKANDDIINNCLHYLKVDFRTYNWKNIMVCGNAWTKLFNRNVSYDFDKVVYSPKNDRLYYPNYNPLVQYVDDVHFNTFMNRVYEWYNNSNLLSKKYEMLYI